MSTEKGFSLTDKLIVEYPPAAKHIANNQQIQEEEEGECDRSLEQDDGPLNLRTDITKMQIICVMAKIGLTSYGGPITQVEGLRKVFVDELQWIGKEVFDDIFSICCSIPGSVLSQMAISIGTLTTGSCTGGLFSFLSFSIPSAAVIGVLGCLYRILDLWQVEVPCYGQLFLHGFASACVAIVIQTAWQFSIQMNVTAKNLWIIIVSCVLYLMYESPIFMIALMVVGGFLMQMMEETQYQRPSLRPGGAGSDDGYSEEAAIDQESRLSRLLQTHRGMFGKVSVYLFIVILGALLLMKISLNNIVVDYAISFFYTGSLLLGGGHVGIPLLLSEFTNLGAVTKNVFFNGFSITNMLPGPMMNLAVYVGGFSDGLRGAIVGYIFLYLPTFLFIWGVLPYWHKCSKDPHIMNFIKGAGLVSTGFVFATSIKLWQNAGQDDMVTSTFLVIISFILLSIYHMESPFVVMIGGLLTVVRYLSLHDYRGVEETDNC